MSVYIYLSFLIILVLFGYEVITSTIKYCPIKIKEAIIFPFILLCFRIGSLLILLLADDIKFVYIVRNFIFLNIIYIPMLIFLGIYVFYRNVKININWIYGLFFTGAGVYIICVLNCPVEYSISMSYGYNIFFDNQLPYKLMIIMNVVAFLSGIKCIRFKYSIKWGSFIIIVASLLNIGSLIISLKSAEYIGYLLIGDLSWIICLYACIVTFKVKAKGQNIKKYIS